jgi:hypothetical protein
MCSKGRLPYGSWHACWVCWLLMLSHARTIAAVPLWSNEDFGIRAYGLVVPSGGSSHHLRAFLRASCREQSGILVYGFIGLFKTDGGLVAARIASHFKSSITSTDGLKLLLMSRVDKHSTPLAVMHVPREGLLRVEALLTGPGPYDLSSAGASWKIELALPCCSCQSSSNDGSRPSSTRSSPTWNTSSPFAPGLWNVLTITSNSQLAIEDLAFLLLQHHKYHRRVGFKGTIVRGSIGQAQLLAKLDVLQQALAHEGLLLWPWVSSYCWTAAAPDVSLHWCCCLCCTMTFDIWHHRIRTCCSGCVVLWLPV